MKRDGDSTSAAGTGFTAEISEILKYLNRLEKQKETIELLNDKIVQYEQQLGIREVSDEDLTDTALTQMNALISGRKEAFDVNRTLNTENEINNFRNQLKSQNINDVNNHKYTYAVGTVYMDIINECEKLGDYVVNVVEARMGTRLRVA